MTPDWGTGQILAGKKHTSTPLPHLELYADYSNYKSPCHVEILSRDPGLEWHPNHTDAEEAEMVHVSRESSKLCRWFKVVAQIDRE